MFGTKHNWKIRFRKLPSRYTSSFRPRLEPREHRIVPSHIDCSVKPNLAHGDDGRGGDGGDVRAVLWEPDGSGGYDIVDLGRFTDNSGTERRNHLTHINAAGQAAGLWIDDHDNRRGLFWDGTTV